MIFLMHFFKDNKNVQEPLGRVQTVILEGITT